MTTISSHVLDVERGVPAVGLLVQLFRADQPIAQAITNADGRVPDLAGAVSAGAYRLVFDIGAYFTAQGRAVPFLRRVTIDFEVHAADPHYHIPLLMSSYACTSYRGS